MSNEFFNRVVAVAEELRKERGYEQAYNFIIETLKYLSEEEDEDE